MPTQKSPDAFRTISEAADWLGTPAHVLRFWESRFPEITPVKRAGGRRYYRPEDLLLIGGIKRLLHDEGNTIKAVQQRIKDDGVAAVAALSPPLEIDETTTEAEHSAPDADDAAPAGRMPTAPAAQGDAAQNILTLRRDRTAPANRAPSRDQPPKPDPSAPEPHRARRGFYFNDDEAAMLSQTKPDGAKLDELPLGPAAPDPPAADDVQEAAAEVPEIEAPGHPTADQSASPAPAPAAAPARAAAKLPPLPEFPDDPEDGAGPSAPVVSPAAELRAAEGRSSAALVDLMRRLRALRDRLD